MQSLTSATGFAGIFGALGAKNVSPKDLLPFPGVLDLSGNLNFSPATSEQIRRLLAKDGIPAIASAEFKAVLHGIN